VKTLIQLANQDRCAVEVRGMAESKKNMARSVDYRRRNKWGDWACEELYVVVRVETGLSAKHTGPTVSMDCVVLFVDELSLDATPLHMCPVSVCGTHRGSTPLRGTFSREASTKKLYTILSQFFITSIRGAWHSAEVTLYIPISTTWFRGSTHREGRGRSPERGGPPDRPRGP